MLKYIFINLIFSFCFISYSNDVTIVGSINSAHGIGSIALGIFDCLKHLKVNLISTMKIQNLDEIDKSVKDILDNQDKTAGKVAIFTELLFGLNTYPYKYIPKDCHIKIAYSMLESTKIPNQWVKILNSEFDAVVVPDKWLLDIYKKSGVNIPIFHLAIPINLIDFLQEDLVSKKNSDFVFGNTCSIIRRKNHIKLIESFSKVFKNAKNVKLKINASFYEKDVLDALQEKVRTLNLNNVEINVKKLNRKDYINFMKSLNCFVSLSKGEGFAIPPREALSLGIPVILSNNTAHKNICKAGFAVPVKSEVMTPATYYVFNLHKEQVGFDFDCKIEDASLALLDIYNNYKNYLFTVKRARQWVLQFTKKFLQKKYITLAKPKKVILGRENLILNECLITNSEKLYKKYLMLENFNIIQNK